MPSRRRPTRSLAAATSSLASRSAAIGMAAPLVVAHRLTRMAMAGVNPTAADHRENSTMVTEKALAFQNAWGAMWLEAASQPLRLAQQAMLAPLQGPAAWMDMLAEFSGPAGMVRMLDAGIGPVHATAVANARRLSRKRTPAARKTARG